MKSPLKSATLLQAASILAKTAILLCYKSATGLLQVCNTQQIAGFIHSFGGQRWAGGGKGYCLGLMNTPDTRRPSHQAKHRPLHCGRRKHPALCTTELHHTANKIQKASRKWD